ncbi:MAG: hypothetical protein Q4G69_11325 [Planctomycetia bacterium]|nr:hypothetical protein [Planctomycetia bacterium]
MVKRTNDEEQTAKKKMLLGLGLDNQDGEARITRGKNFTLLGGSKDTHEVMQETAIKVNEKLNNRGKTLDEVAPEELGDIIRDVQEDIGK